MLSAKTVAQKPDGKVIDPLSSSQIGALAAVFAWSGSSARLEHPSTITVVADKSVMARQEVERRYMDRAPWYSSTAGKSRLRSAPESNAAAVPEGETSNFELRTSNFELKPGNFSLDLDWPGLQFEVRSSKFEVRPRQRP
jgi:hypothetical protein